LFNTSRY